MPNTAAYNPLTQTPSTLSGKFTFTTADSTKPRRRFCKPFEINNAFIGGGDLYRAALSRFLAGDRAKADEHFRRYIEFRQKHNDAVAPLREAIWLYVTGRRDEARRKAGGYRFSRG